MLIDYNLLTEQSKIVDELGKDGVVAALRKALTGQAIMPRVHSVREEIVQIEEGTLPWNPKAFVEAMSLGVRRKAVFNPDTKKLELRDIPNNAQVDLTQWEATFAARLQGEGAKNLIASPRQYSGSALIAALLETLKFYHYSVIWGEYSEKRSFDDVYHRGRAVYDTASLALAKALDVYAATTYKQLCLDGRAYRVPSLDILPRVYYWISVPFTVATSAPKALIPAVHAVEVKAISEMCQYQPDVSHKDISIHTTRRVSGDFTFPHLVPSEHALMLNWRYHALQLNTPEFVMEKMR